MLNINEQDLKEAIAQKAADEILSEDHDLTNMIAKEVKSRLDTMQHRWGVKREGLMRGSDPAGSGADQLPVASARTQ
jgi:hypothetical protein